MPSLRRPRVPQATGSGEVFRPLVLARIIEPTSKQDSLRVLEEAGPSRAVVSHAQPAPAGLGAGAVAAATGRRRAVAGLPCSRPPGRARGGVRGAISGAVMAASPRGAAGPSGGLQAGGRRVQAMSGSGKISPVWVSEGRLLQIANPLHRCSPVSFRFETWPVRGDRGSRNHPASITEAVIGMVMVVAIVPRLPRSRCTPRRVLPSWRCTVGAPADPAVLARDWTRRQPGGRLQPPSPALRELDGRLPQ